MTNNKLASAIKDAIADASLQIVAAVKNSTLDDLLALQGDSDASKQTKFQQTLLPFASSSPDVIVVRTRKPRVEKKRTHSNYPKCAYPGCGRNLFMRGKGFCGLHWKMWLAGEIEDAEHYKQLK